MSYNVYTAEYLGSPNHVGIFVETESNGNGLNFHVTGSILAGMIYECKAAKRPDDSATFVPGTKIRIGSLEKSKLSDFESVCRSVPAPGAQVRLNGMPKDPSKPIRRCGDWVGDVKEKIIADGILGS
ncbi:Hypothetical protein R9X50_00594500 [Acrodontium crateriforme]|uniref:Uncharacterized protein n=1 Tax=Acrodontium crateriforme TaxID=150365 RepID=A0AAQ3MAS0_9PEZI|nr:Hypothetical protein R9X50_00594500 [Acrodontium crateriforme]